MFKNMDKEELIITIIIGLLIFMLLLFLVGGIYSEIMKPDNGIIYDMAEIEPHYEQNVSTAHIYNGKTMTPIVNSSSSLKERTWVLFIKDNDTGRTNEIEVSKEVFNKYKIGDYYE